MMGFLNIKECPGAGARLLPVRPLGSNCMKSPHSLAVVIGIAIAGSSVAQQQCSTFEGAIDVSLKNMALEEAMGIGDNSAPRETNRLLRMNNELQAINAHLMLMAQNKCPPIRYTLSTAPYRIQAAECKLATLKGEDKPPACEMKNWQKKF